MSYPNPLTVSANVKLEMSSENYLLCVCVCVCGVCVCVCVCTTYSGGCDDDPMLQKRGKIVLRVGASQLGKPSQRSGTGGMQCKNKLTNAGLEPATFRLEV